MNSKLILIACLVLPFALTACSKQEKAPAAEQTSTSEATQELSNVSPEQQAAIDAIDQPLQDENNTDIPQSVANAPADQATADETAAASTAQ